jgi:hypothetical protein
MVRFEHWPDFFGEKWEVGDKEKIETYLREISDDEKRWYWFLRVVEVSRLTRPGFVMYFDKEGNPTERKRERKSEPKTVIITPFTEKSRDICLLLARREAEQPTGTDHGGADLRHGRPRTHS